MLVGPPKAGIYKEASLRKSFIPRCADFQRLGVLVDNIGINDCADYTPTNLIPNESSFCRAARARYPLNAKSN
jgi:hypothetical protein